MTLHLNFPGSLGSRQAEHQQQQIREARKELKERVRNDWEYPTLPAHQSCGRRVPKANEKAAAERVAGFRFHYASNHDREGEAAAGPIALSFEPTEWRERIYSSGSDSDDPSNAVAATPTSNSSSSSSSKKGKQKAYKFDNPDSVGTQISERRIARKRRRQKALEEEMEWNDGLAHWMRRRDVWSCARTTTQVNALADKAQASLSPPATASAENDDSSSSSTTHATDPAASSSSSSASTSSSSPRTSTSGTLALPLVANGGGGGGGSSSSSSSSTSSSPASPHSSQQTPISSPSTTPDLPSTTPSDAPDAPPTLAVLLPVAPALLPNHPVRRRITPHLYPEIYSKVILQSRAPSVPINLASLLRALVQGWKDDGEWPPKPAPAEKAVGRKKGSGGHDGGGGGGGAGGSGGSSSLRQGVRAVGRVLRWSGAGEHGKGEGG